MSFLAFLNLIKIGVIMSIAYLIGFDKKLTKNQFLYKDILKSKKIVFCENDGITFTLQLLPQEDDIAKKLFQGRVVYSIRATVPLDCNLQDKGDIGEEYYMCEKEQLEWFIEFLKKHISSDEDCLFVQIALGTPINYQEILSKCLDLNQIKISDNFSFCPGLVYQFTNNYKLS